MTASPHPVTIRQSVYQYDSFNTPSNSKAVSQLQQLPRHFRCSYKKINDPKTSMTLVLLFRSVQTNWGYNENIADFCHKSAIICGVWPDWKYIQVSFISMAVNPCPQPQPSYGRGGVNQLIPSPGSSGEAAPPSERRATTISGQTQVSGGTDRWRDGGDRN